MKSTALFALFLLCVFTSYLPSSTADDVLDTDGDVLQNGGTYYVLPVIRGRGGGIERAKTGIENCPLSVVQSHDELSKGKPIKISSPAKIAIIHEDLPLNFGFTSAPSCAPSPSIWTIVKGLSEGSAVKITGYKHNVVDGSFRIKKASLEYNDYTILFCTRDDGTCEDIGIYVGDDGKRRLVLTQDRPLLVKFQKVGSSSTA